MTFCLPSNHAHIYIYVVCVVCVVCVLCVLCVLFVLCVLCCLCCVCYVVCVVCVVCDVCDKPDVSVAAPGTGEHLPTLVGGIRTGGGAWGGLDAATHPRRFKSGWCFRCMISSYISPSAIWVELKFSVVK